MIELVYRTVREPSVWPRVFAALRRIGVPRHVSRDLLWQHSPDPSSERGPAGDVEAGSPDLASDAGRRHGRDVLAVLEPHVERALRTRRRLEARRSLIQYTRSAIEHADFGCIQVDPQRRVIWKNPAAGEFLEATRGLCVENGELHAALHEDQPSLERMLDDAFDPSTSANAGESAPLLLPATASRRAAIKVYPAKSARPMAAPCPPEKTAFVVVDEPTNVSLRKEDLCALYELTPAEADVARWVALGRTPKEIAATLDRSIHTVRTHLKRIYAKTGTSGRPELVGRLLRGLARLRRAPVHAPR